MSQVRTDYSSENWIPEESEVLEVMARASTDYGDSLQSVTFLIRLNHNDCVSDLSDPRVFPSVHVLASLISTLEYVDTVDSITADIKNVNDGNLPQTLETSKKILEEHPHLRSRFNSDYSYMTFDARGASFEEDDVLEFGREIESVRFPDGVDVVLVGDAPKDVEMNKRMDADGEWTTLLGFILVFLIASFIYRSPVAGVLTLLPIFFALVWTVSMMGLIDLPFTGMSIAMAPMIMGVGIDFSIHLYHRIKQELKAGNPVEDAVCIAVPSVGGALFASTTTTIVCFMVLVVAATLLVVNRLGATLVIGVGFSFIAAIWMVPAIAVLEGRFKDRFIRSRSLGG